MHKACYYQYKRSGLRAELTRRCGSVCLGVGVLRVREIFKCVLGMREECSSVVYFRGWLRCVKWKKWSYIAHQLVSPAVVC